MQIMKIMNKKKASTKAQRVQLPILIMQKKGLLIIRQGSKNKINYTITCQRQMRESLTEFFIDFLLILINKKTNCSIEHITIKLH